MNDQGGMADLLCGHWTFFTLGGNRNATARCDLAEGHEGLHKFWHSPETGESFSWADSYERHVVRDD